MKTIRDKNMIIELDNSLKMDDGITIRYDVYRPDAEGQFPAIITYGPYSKGMHFSQGYGLFWKRIKTAYPEILEGTSGKYMNWETVDPEKWVPEGYVVVKVDSRGTGRSKGVIDSLSDREAQDFHDCIEHIASQPWCDGKVAGLGISYYAMMLWAVAAKRPPHLAAIIPFEGASDFYREFARHGGIGHDFAHVWYPLQVGAVQHGLGKFGQKGAISGDYVSGPETLSRKELTANRSSYLADMVEQEMIDDPVYQHRKVDLSQIDIPVLSAGNWGGNALHLRGNVEGYLAIPSKDKFLEIHGLEHFTEFYTDYGRQMQQAFLDHYLKGLDTWHQAPVQLRLRNVDGSFTDRGEEEWPLKRTEWTKFYLHEDGDFATEHPDDFALAFDADGDGLHFFTQPLDQEVEITGPIAGHLPISSTTEDADIFLTMRVLDPDGKDVSFVSANDEHGVIATGWLRASHRKLDPEKTRPYRPYHSHDEKQLLEPNQIVPLDIEVWPTSVIIPKGYRLGFYVGGKDFAFPDKEKWSRVDVSAYTKPRILSSLYKTLTAKGILKLLTHEKIWKGQAMYTHTTDRKSKAFNGTTTIHSSQEDRPYILLPIIPKK